MTVQIKVKPEPKYGLTSLVGSVDLPYDMEGSTLTKELSHFADKFVRDMELRGFILYRDPRLPNPTWVTWDEGVPKAYYAIDWLGERTRSGPDGNPMPTRRETSLEESEGMVEYRIIGIFISRERAVEILTTEEDIRAKEQAARNPVSFKGGF